MKKRTLLLNISAILGAVYHILFVVGYLLHKPLFGKMFCTPDALEKIEPVYSLPVFIVTALCGIVFAALVLLMKKHTGKSFFISTAIFSGCAFVAERWVNYLAPASASFLNTQLSENGELGVLAAGMSRGSVLILDNCLLVLFAAAIALMCCAFCIKKHNMN